MGRPVSDNFFRTFSETLQAYEDALWGGAASRLGVSGGMLGVGYQVSIGRDAKRDAETASRPLPE